VTNQVKAIHIFINGHKFETVESQLTGAQIKSLGGVPSGETLYLKHGNSEDPIADDKLVKLRNGLKFESAPDGGVS
jgi:hypothetical protein